MVELKSALLIDDSKGKISLLPRKLLNEKVRSDLKGFERLQRENGLHTGAEKHKLVQFLNKEIILSFTWR